MCVRAQFGLCTCYKNKALRGSACVCVCVHVRVRVYVCVRVSEYVPGVCVRFPPWISPPFHCKNGFQMRAHRTVDRS